MYSVLKNTQKSLPVLIICFFAVACANFSKAPGGGPKDELAPECLSFHPTNYTSGVHVNPPGIILKFDEFIKIKDYEKFLSSPPLFDVRYQVKLKELHIYISDTLKQEISYSLNMSGAVADITEENVQNNLRYVFSTGKSIDTLFVEGFVKDAWTGDGVYGLNVALYSSLPDTFPFKEKPLYLTKTDSSGYFKAEHLKNDCFRVFAFEDGNKNLLPDPLDERVAYSYQCLPSVGFSDTSNHAHEKPLLLHWDRIPSLFVKEGQLLKPGRIKVNFFYPIDSLTYLILRKDSLIDAKIFPLWTEDRTEVTLCLDSFLLRDFALVLGKGIYTDTIDFLYTAEIKAAEALKISSSASGTMVWSNPLFLSFSNPIQKYYTDSVLLCTEIAGKDTQVLQCRLMPVDSWTAQIPLNFKEGASYKLCVQKGAVEDIYGKLNDSTDISWKTGIKENYGIFRFKVKGMKKDHQYILDFVDEKKKLIRREIIQASDSNLVYPQIPPANYGFRLIEDANKNAYWDQASYMDKSFTEKVFYFPKIIKIEADWEFEEEWLLPEDKH